MIFADLLGQLTLEEKVRILTGQDFWSTHPLPGIGLRDGAVRRPERRPRSGLGRARPVAQPPVGDRALVVVGPRHRPSVRRCLGPRGPSQERGRRARPDDQPAPVTSRRTALRGVQRGPRSDRRARRRVRRRRPGARYLGGNAPIADTAVFEFRTTYTPTENGNILLGFASVGHSRIFADGNLLLEETAVPVGTDLGAALLSPPSISAPLEVTAGLPIDVRVELDLPEHEGGLSNALSITVGVEPDRSDPQALIDERQAGGRDQHCRADRLTGLDEDPCAVPPEQLDQRLRGGLGRPSSSRTPVRAPAGCWPPEQPG